MARIIKTNDNLRNEYDRCRKIRNCGYLGIAFFFILFGINAMNFGPMSSSFVIMLAFLGCGILTSHYDGKTKSYKSGIDGEQATAQIISELPDAYVGFQNLKMKYDGKESELDMVVLGPTGVFVIETKNLNGTIVGNYENQQWTQKKVGQQGTPYSKNFYNPIKQVGTHVYRLANILKNNGFPVYVNDMVYFSNPDAVVQLLGEKGKTPVFTALGNSENDIREHILFNDQYIPQDVVWNMAKLLEKMKGANND